MRIKLLIVLLSINSFISFGQDSYDEIKIYVDRNSQGNFYEGQSINFNVVVENISNSSKNYENSLVPFIQKIEKVGYGEIKKKEWKKINNHHDFPKKENLEKSTVKYPVPPKFKYTAPIFTAFDMYGDKTLKDYLPINDQEYNSLWLDPLYFSPGIYEFTIACFLAPSDKVIKLVHKIEVLPANGKIKESFNDYLKAVYKTIKESRAKNEDNFSDQSNLLLLQTLKKDFNSPYAQDIINLLALELNFKIGFIYTFRENPHQIFNIFQVLPELSSFNSLYIGTWFIRSYTHMITKFQSEGLINDIPTFLDNYLLKIKHLHPDISEDLIRESEYYLGVKNLKNYSAELNKKK